MSAHETVDYGGSARAVQYHYDIGREFYGLWLDSTMAYSCAQWADDDPASAEPLESAQRRKFAFHLGQSRATRARRVLDIGCGWGGLMQCAAALPDVERVVGLTLSDDQADYVSGLELPNAHVRLESWVDHAPDERYGAIVSIGAFEHFAKPEDSIADKIAVYRDFFVRCRDWLEPGGRLSLQTIAYGSMRRDEASEFINNEIFPAADLPTFAEIAQAADGVLEIVETYNHRLHYARTMEAWARNLRKRRDEAVSLVGEAVVERYERYLTQSAMGFYMGKIGLLRIAFRPITTNWRHSATP
ncbi:SAM-dependent methyltransferase [Burkholderia ubonensis]|uniref:SAM-dependent methyltransferase n=1 Tax=Burkholderia ubonensis TaxID=101571 RepID=UPI0007520253|nr:cyclopropane-fatty-acyl-phospholipid synthase family protein [Burkholderia ubonensis]AOI68045.1 cyclopropane-fatty-acyl-phospholipid synthase [Burkholderia ubonensis]KUZ22996.1 cyclopropane-fatty-acyl-phospholipid synthase [Burkholderia ubonensis]KUZ24744.1 cyclopropane-fatty-acyl-phospholipid synthase [Burkholderia ubonensis]KUZ36676.1 cyclopropane-fatty-acyl-phospholipid synthase [Burkholderia ubonensis]KUZ51458.1 cyclopropane-fatty-acyl-phospholipid synthase [Burkholderia ubonensis]